jgi:hypothetical protein
MLQSIQSEFKLSPLSARSQIEYSRPSVFSRRSRAMHAREGSTFYPGPYLYHWPLRSIENVQRERPAKSS